MLFELETVYKTSIPCEAFNFEKSLTFLFSETCAVATKPTINEVIVKINLVMILYFLNYCFKIQKHLRFCYLFFQKAPFRLSLQLFFVKMTHHNQNVLPLKLLNH